MSVIGYLHGKSLYIDASNDARNGLYFLESDIVFVLWNGKLFLGLMHLDLKFF